MQTSSLDKFLIPAAIVMLVTVGSSVGCTGDDCVELGNDTSGQRPLCETSASGSETTSETTGESTTDASTMGSTSMMTAGTTTTTTTTTTMTTMTTMTMTTMTMTTMTTGSPVCGDGTQDNGEGCDDGADTPMCNSDSNNPDINGPGGCQMPACGDDYTNPNANPPEQCDDGAMNGNMNACKADCTLNICGDGSIHAGVEACDDGNTVAGDGCSAGCVVERVVFVTSTKWEGNLSGLAGADAKCQTAAQGGGLSGMYMAWLSDGTNGPNDRFPESAKAFSGTFVLKGGMPVAHGWAELVGGRLQSPINKDEGGTVKETAVWTNTAVNGMRSGADHCDGWTNSSNGFKGHLGLSDLMDAAWTDAESSAFCSQPASLYCIQVQ